MSLKLLLLFTQPANSIYIVIKMNKMLYSLEKMTCSSSENGRKASGLIISDVISETDWRMSLESERFSAYNANMSSFPYRNSASANFLKLMELGTVGVVGVFGTNPDDWLAPEEFFILIRIKFYAGMVTKKS